MILPIMVMSEMVAGGGVGSWPVYVAATTVVGVMWSEL